MGAIVYRSPIVGIIWFDPAGARRTANRSPGRLCRDDTCAKATQYLWKPLQLTIQPGLGGKPWFSRPQRVAIV